MNKIIVDGYNMIYRIPKLARMMESDLEQARSELIWLLKSYLVRARVHIVLVFDGKYAGLNTTSPRVKNRLQIIFSKHPIKADPIIKKMLHDEKKKKGLTLVSEDKELMQYARSAGSQVLSPAEFLHRIEKRVYKNELHNKYDMDLSEEEIAEWLEIFGEK